MLEKFFTFLYNKNTCGYGGMADALGSGPSGGNSMEVQVLLTAPEKTDCGWHSAIGGRGPRKFLNFWGDSGRRARFRS